MGPTANFVDVKEAKGGVTPPLQIQSDSDEGKHELTPTNINIEVKGAKNTVLIMTPPSKKIQEPRSLSDSIFARIDVPYVLNILRH